MKMFLAVLCSAVLATVTYVGAEKVGTYPLSVQLFGRTGSFVSLVYYPCELSWSSLSNKMGPMFQKDPFGQSVDELIRGVASEHQEELECSFPTVRIST